MQKKLPKIKLKHLVLIECLCLILMLGISAASYASVKTKDAPKKEVVKEVNKEDETIIKEVDEFVWTTDTVDARKGPGERYEYLTTFNKEIGVQRTGITKNNWSRVVSDEKTYYIPNKYLSLKSPFNLDEGDKGVLQEYALSQFYKYGWDESEMDELITLWNKESGWNPRAENPESGAYGIPQSLPAEKLATEGPDWKTNGKTQIDWGLKYIKDRYGSPTKALEFHLEHNWY